MLERGQPALANHLRQGAASAVADARILASKLTRVTFLVLAHRKGENGGSFAETRSL